MGASLYSLYVLSTLMFLTPAGGEKCLGRPPELVPLTSAQAGMAISVPKAWRKVELTDVAQGVLIRDREGPCRVSAMRVSGKHPAHVLALQERLYYGSNRLPEACADQIRKVAGAGGPALFGEYKAREYSPRIFVMALPLEGSVGLVVYRCQSVDSDSTTWSDAAAVMGSVVWDWQPVKDKANSE